MTEIGIWTIGEEGPVRCSRTSVSLERELEDWIERDPDLLMTGLTIVGRQMTMGSNRLDLLGITPEGQWALIELKAGGMHREVLSQALDYASLIQSLEAEDLLGRLNRLNDKSRTQVEDLLGSEDEGPDGGGRDMVIVLSGTSVGPGLQRIVSFLAEGYGVPIVTITFDVFSTRDGTQLLVRETSEPKQEPRRRRRFSVEAVEALAAEKGCAEAFSAVLECGRDLGLHLRPWKHSVTLNSPANRTRTLVYVTPAGTRVYIGWHDNNWTDLHGVTEEDISETIGRHENWTSQDPEAAALFIDRLRELWRRATESSDESADD
jgi:hypothetical protein